MFPLSPDYCKGHFPIEVNWPGADGTHFEGCSLGQSGRISAELWKLWSELFHETEQRELLLRLPYGIALFSGLTLSSQMLRSNPAWSGRIQLISSPHLLRVYT